MSMKFHSENQTFDIKHGQTHRIQKPKTTGTSERQIKTFKDENDDLEF